MSTRPPTTARPCRSAGDVTCVLVASRGVTSGRRRGRRDQPSEHRRARRRSRAPPGSSPLPRPGPTSIGDPGADERGRRLQVVAILDHHPAVSSRPHEGVPAGKIRDASWASSCRYAGATMPWGSGDLTVTAIAREGSLAPPWRPMSHDEQRSQDETPSCSFPSPSLRLWSKSHDRLIAAAVRRDPLSASARRCAGRSL